MKKYIIIGLLTISVLAVIAIGIKETTSSPSETVTGFFTAVMGCRSEEVIKHVSHRALSEIEEYAREEGKTLEELIKEAERECQRELEEIKDFRIEILSEGPLSSEEEEELREEWNLKKAEEIVEVEYEIFFDGDHDKDSLYLIKEDGSWKILFGD